MRLCRTTCHWNIRFLRGGLEHIWFFGDRYYVKKRTAFQDSSEVGRVRVSCCIYDVENSGGISPLVCPLTLQKDNETLEVPKLGVRTVLCLKRDALSMVKV